MVATKVANADEFDWIQLSNDVNENPETFTEKLKRKVAENPFVPIGL